MLADPKLAQKELTVRAATNTIRELSKFSYASIKRIAQDEYNIHTVQADKSALIQQIANRIMEQA